MRAAICVLATALLFAVLLGGCYNPNLTGPGGFACVRGECPSGFVCQSSMCVRPGTPDARPDARSDARFDQRPGTIVCQAPAKVNPIDTSVVGDGFDFERSNTGVLVVSYTRVASRDLWLARRAGAGLVWTTKQLESDVGESTAVAIDEEGCANHGTLVAYRTSGVGGNLQIRCDGCVWSQSVSLDPQAGVGANVDIIPHTPSQCTYWVAYQVGATSGTYLRRRLLAMATPSTTWTADVEVPASTPVTHIAQDWDTTTHTITYISGAASAMKVYRATAFGEQSSTWTTWAPIDAAAEHPDDRGVAQVGSGIAYATGPLATPRVRYTGGGLLQEVALGSRPSLASNGTYEAVAFVQGQHGYVIAHNSDGSWGPVAAQIAGANRILIRAGDNEQDWEVVFRTATRLDQATVTCR